MLNVVLLILASVILLALIGLGVAGGYFWRDIRMSLSALRSRVATLEESDIPEPAVFDAKTPREVKEHQFDEEDEDSAIIVAKKPAELRREKDRKLDEELDRLGR